MDASLHTPSAAEVARSASRKTLDPWPQKYRSPLCLSRRCLLRMWHGFHLSFYYTFKNSAGPVGIHLSGIAALSFLVDCAAMHKRRTHEFYFLVAPIFLVLLASGLCKYPFGGRLILFLALCLLLLIGEGVWRIIEKSRDTSHIFEIALAVFLLIFPIYDAMARLARFKIGKEIRPLLVNLRIRWEQGDVLYVYLWGLPCVQILRRSIWIREDPIHIGDQEQSRLERLFP